MSDFMALLQVLALCGFLLVLAFLILLALPQSKLRAVLMPIVGWSLAIFCGIYCLSPVDIIPEAMLGPFGLLDDGVALFGGIAAAMAAKNAAREC